MATKKKATKKAAKKKAIGKKVTAKKAAIPAKKKASVKAPSKKTAPAKKKAAKTKVTTIRSQLDIGWGNSLFIRGEGAGLSWDSGIRMDWVDGEWVWSTTKTAKNIQYKLLINDDYWSAGENEEAAPGKTSISAATF